MARRSKQTKKRSPWPLILLMVTPLVLLAGLMLLISSVPPRSAAEIQRERERRQAVAATLAESGASMQTNRAGIHVITLPAAEALTVSRAGAMELALTARSRLGGIVRVQSPAGQVLAEAR